MERWLSLALRKPDGSSARYAELWYPPGLPGLLSVPSRASWDQRRAMGEPRGESAPPLLRRSP